MLHLKSHVLKDDKFFWSLSLSSLFYLVLCTGQFFLLSCSSQSNEKINTNPSDTTQVKINHLKPLTPEEKLQNLEIEHAFWKNRLQLARDETLDLIVDLVDSIITLEIKGVPVRNCKIHHYYISKSLNELKKNQDVLEWLAYPFELEDDWSNIPKEPIKIKEINSDDSTTESIMDLYKEKLPDIQVALFFSRGLSIYMDHTYDEFPSDSSLFKLMNKNSFKEVQYLVKIKINASDVKAIYRGLSDKSGLSFRY